MIYDLLTVKSMHYLLLDFKASILNILILKYLIKKIQFLINFIFYLKFFNSARNFLIFLKIIFSKLYSITSFK